MSDRNPYPTEQEVFITGMASEVAQQIGGGGGEEYTAKFASIAAIDNGDNTLVAAVSGKKIRVLALMLIAAGDVSIRFQSGAAGAYLSGLITLVAQAGFTLPYSPVGWMETASGVLLNLEETDGPVVVSGVLVYAEV